MKLNMMSRMLIAVPVALLGSQVLAKNWVTIASKNYSTGVDKDSIRRGSDGLVYFTDQDVLGDEEFLAADCPRRTVYLLKDDVGDYPDWRDHGLAIKPGSIEEAELQYVCANAR